jgi:hypothetical protein
MITIHDQQTNEVITREMNDEEFAAFELSVAKDAEERAQIEQANADRAALLTRLGMTAEEAKLLLS